LSGPLLRSRGTGSPDGQERLERLLHRPQTARRPDPGPGSPDRSHPQPHAAADPQLIIGLNQAVVAGNLSRRSYLKALTEAEIVTIEDIDMEMQEIEKEGLGSETVQSGDNGGNRPFN